MHKLFVFLNTLVMALIGLLFLCAGACASEGIPMEVRLAQTACGRSAEYVMDLSEGWRFGGRGEDASAEDYDDGLWTHVNLPHTWNIADGADGGSNYVRSTFWYRKDLDINDTFAGKRVYLEFLGANQKTDLYVNGRHIRLCGSSGYTHEGGYTAFRYDLTDALREGRNTIAVRVNNEKTEKIAPIDADFNMYGGIYRRVYLIAVDSVHIDLSDSGSSGLFLTTPNVRSKERPDDFGALNIWASIVNKNSESRTITATAHIEGDHAPEDIVRTFTVPAGGSAVFDADTYISDPHLWKGIDYSGKTDNSDVGYRYTVTLTLWDGERIIDAVSDQVGFRFFYVDKETGFYLNGESHPLRGVNRHQFKEGMGSAITEKEHEEDIEIIMELGANTVRLCHYPHTDYFYDLCDRNGIILWTEIPLVNKVGTADGFVETTKNQLVELIRQQYNRPSVCFWGLQNEVAENARSSITTTKALLLELDELVHEEDRTGRYSTQAIQFDEPMDQNDPSNLADNGALMGWKSDLLGWNVYTGWYSRYQGTFEDYINGKAAQDSRPLALSEYGWGGSTEQHELYPELGKNGLASGSKWHPEEYQCLMHEAAIAYINTHDSLWGTYIWCMFDFDVDKRDEGSRVAQNDKGLVSNDRKTKKDSFYLYKANWDKREPFVHIASSRYTERTSARTYVKVYSNCDRVKLYNNGEWIGDLAGMGNGIFLLEDMSLDIGENKLRAVGEMDGRSCEDICFWTRPVCNDAKLTSEELFVNEEAHTVTISRLLTLGELKEVLTGVNNAKYTVLWNGEEVTDGNALILQGMTAPVTAEDEENTSVYTFIPNNRFSRKKISATSHEEGNPPQNAVDGDGSTRWVAASNVYPQTITVDMGDVCDLGTLTIDWYKDKDRYYAYTVEVSEDGTNFIIAADCTENTFSGAIHHDLRMKGRYVRINVYSCSNRKGYAAIHEITMDCWSLSSSEYEIDHDGRLIIVPGTKGLTPEAFTANLALDGNCGCSVQAETGFIDEGTHLVITDYRGVKTVYTVTAAENAYRYPTDLALNKKIYFSSEEGISQSDGRDTRATNVNDGLADTAWVADTKINGVTGIRANYPEWICVDLGRECFVTGIELLFETKGERIYQYQVYTSSDAPFSKQNNTASDYHLLINQLDNASFENGHYLFDGLEGVKARYITVLVSGNSLYAQKKSAAAGIYELKVYGTTHSASAAD